MDEHHNPEIKEKVLSSPPAEAHAPSPTGYRRAHSSPLFMNADHIEGDSDYPWKACMHFFLDTAAHVVVCYNHECKP